MKFIQKPGIPLGTEAIFTSWFFPIPSICLNGMVVWAERAHMVVKMELGREGPLWVAQRWATPEDLKTLPSTNSFRGKFSYRREE